MFEQTTAVAAAQDHRGPSSPSTTKKRLKILIVDDEPAIVRAIGRLLHRDHDVVKQYSVRGALDALGREAFDVILSDLDIGSDSGLKILETARHEQPEAFRILMSARQPTELPRVGRVVQRFIQKPFANEDLRAAVETKR